MKKLLLILSIFCFSAITTQVKADENLCQVGLSDTSDGYCKSHHSFDFDCGWLGGIINKSSIPSWEYERYTKIPATYIEFKVKITDPYNGYPKDGVSIQEYNDHIWDYYRAFLKDPDVGNLMKDFEVCFMEYIQNPDGTVSNVAVGSCYALNNKGYFLELQ